jgi:hypothetical protein
MSVDQLIAVQLDNPASRPECQQPITCHFERSEKSRLGLRRRGQPKVIGLGNSSRKGAK